MERKGKNVSKETERARFTKVASGLLLGVRDLVNWGIDTGNTTPEKLQLTVAARKEAATKLVESGMSQRRAAKVLGVGEATIRRDVRQNDADSAPERRTGSEKTKTKRAAVTARASGKGATQEPSEKYRIIYADPPWSYGNTQPDYHTEQRDHYAVMELAAICAMPVESWVEDDAVLFLWVTSPILEESFQVVEAWGFKYKASFVWDKIKHNMGHYNSVRHEMLLICTRGSCQPDVRQLFDSVQSIERTQHSKKPTEFYDIIETLYTRGRKLEIFARGEREGWDVYGHQAELEAAE